MRMATSKGFTATVCGTRGTIAIVDGTVVDLDQVVGESSDGKNETLAGALGGYVAEFDVHKPAKDETPAHETRRRGGASKTERGADAAEE